MLTLPLQDPSQRYPNIDALKDAMDEWVATYSKPVLSKKEDAKQEAIRVMEMVKGRHELLEVSSTLYLHKLRDGWKSG